MSAVSAAFPHRSSVRRAAIVALSGWLAIASWLAYADAPPAPVSLTTEEDHQRTMKLLGIESLRRGADGRDPNAPNAANYDESKANPFPTLPDPLRLKNGKRVETAKEWWEKRRPEIVEDFAREVYGRQPANTPSVTWEVLSEGAEKHGDIPVTTKHLVGRVDNSGYPLVDVNIDLTVTTPAAAKGPVPVIMEFQFKFPPSFNAEFRARADAAARDWQQQVLKKGWGFALYTPTSVQADNGAGLTQGIIGLMNKGQPRQLDDWGALRAWGWGASRALDYLETDSRVDAKKVGIEGHSRFGKAVLVTMADDPRFAIAYVSSSGAAGAKLHRRNFGELVENTAAASEYHWLAGNFLKYAGPLQWDDLPVDSHELIALAAPRPIFIGTGTVEEGDGWVDPKGMFMAAAAAGPVYALLGRRGLGTDTFPSTGTALVDGDIAYRQHEGGHTPGPNWAIFLDFAARYFE
jgi:hypothetical protein